MVAGVSRLGGTGQCEHIAIALASGNHHHGVAAHRQCGCELAKSLALFQGSLRLCGLEHLRVTTIERQSDCLDTTVIFNTLRCSGTREFVLSDREAINMNGDRR